MKHPDDQLAAARDLLADGLSRAEAAARLAADFGVSLRTGQRIVSAVSCDMSDTDEPGDTERASTDYVALALQAMARSLQAAEAAGDFDAVAIRAEQLAGMSARTKVRHAP